MTIKTMIFTHHPRVSLARLWFCWWRHNQLLMTSQWPDNHDAITWIVISNSLDTDFIHGDIHGGSCKKVSLNHFAKAELALKGEINEWCQYPSTQTGLALLSKQTMANCVMKDHFMAEITLNCTAITLYQWPISTSTCINPCIWLIFVYVYMQIWIQFNHPLCSLVCMMLHIRGIFDCGYW